MATTTKKALIDRIAGATKHKRLVVKTIVQAFLDEVMAEVGRGNRLEFRDFGVFETKWRAERQAQNPKTLDPVTVPAHLTVKFKVGREMREQLDKAATVVQVSPASRAKLNGKVVVKPQRRAKVAV